MNDKLIQTKLLIADQILKSKNAKHRITLASWLRNVNERLENEITHTDRLMLHTRCLVCFSFNCICGKLIS